MSWVRNKASSIFLMEIFQHIFFIFDIQMCYTEPNISYILQHISHVWPICIHIHFGSYGYIYSFSCSRQGLIAHSLSARPVKRPPSYQDRTSYSSIYIYTYMCVHVTLTMTLVCCDITWVCACQAYHVLMYEIKSIIINEI